MENLTRRSFIIGAATLGGAMVLGGCSSAPTADNATQDGQQTADANADVIVVGSGLAGSSCAISAAQAGASVVLIDKAPFLASTFLTSKGNVSIAQVPENEDFWQFASDEPDTMEAFIARYQTMTEIGKTDAPWPDYDRVQRVMQESCETIEWLKQIGIDFEKSFTKEQVGTDTVKPPVDAESTKQAGEIVADAFAAELDRLGVDVRLSCEVTSLATEGDAVCGVVAKSGSAEETIAAKAVVLACGGFGGSDAYRDKLVPAINELGFQYRGNALNTGDAMTLTADLGAATYDDCWVVPFVIMPSRALTDANEGFATLCDNGMEGGGTSDKLLVDATGTRIVNEAGPVTELACAMADAATAPCYVLFDSSNAEVAALAESGIATGDVIKGGTIEELAQAIGADILPATFDAYQQACADGVDAAFGKPATMLVPYQDGPFYLVKFVPSFVATIGGVITDGDCRAIRDDESVIDGLYVIGESTHHFMYNRSFVRHCSNSSALTMGRLTGAAIASL